MTDETNGETDAQAWARGQGLTIEDVKKAIRDVRENVPSRAAARLANPVVGWSDVSRFDGLPVYVQRNWPKVQRGTRKRRFPAHPLFLWLARKLRRPAWFELRAPSWSYLEITVPNL